MSKASDEELAFLSDLVQDVEWQEEEIDRLMAWELFQMALRESPMSIFLPKNQLFEKTLKGFDVFYDKIGLSKNYAHIACHRIKQKIKKNADRENFRITYVRQKRT
jgi:ASC-1-like (ASCH) protein